MRHFAIISSLVLAGAYPTGSANAQTPAPAAGEGLFRQRCQSCHSVAAGRPSSMGPNLAGVAGRSAATGTFAYSPALKKSGIVWTKENLDRFLAGPAKMVPGTKMFISVPDAKQRAALADYLSGLR